MCLGTRACSGPPALPVREFAGPGECADSAWSPQFAAWVDAVVFVFSLEDEISFQTVYNYFLRLCSFRNASEVPMVLVGTQGEAGPAESAREQGWGLPSLGGQGQ